MTKAHLLKVLTYFRHPIMNALSEEVNVHDNLLERWQQVEYLPMRFGLRVIDVAAQALPRP